MPSKQSPSTKAVSAEENFFLMLNAACTRVQKFTEEGLQSAGLTLAEYTMLRIVENTPGVTAGEAKLRLYATAPAVAQLVAQLERRDMLSRGQDPHDARRLPLRLTTKGSKHLQSAKRAVLQHIQSMKLPSGLLDSMTSDLSILLTTLSSHGTR